MRSVDATGTREVRRRLLPARLVVYFVLALWLFRGRNCGYGQVMVKLADGLYHRRRGADLLAGQLDPDGWVSFDHPTQKQRLGSRPGNGVGETPPSV